MKKDLIEKIDISLEKNSDYKEMTILTLQSAKEVLQIYMNLESDYVASQKTLDNEIASFRDRTQEVKDKIDEFYNSSSVTLEQVKQAQELCESIKEQVINYSSHIDEIQDKIESDKKEMATLKTQSEDLTKQSQDYRDQIIDIKDEINATKTSIEEYVEQGKETFENNLKLLDDSINDFNSKLEEFKNQISTLVQEEKIELETQLHTSKDEIATLVQESKEDIEKITTQSQDQIQKLLENIPKDNPITINGVEATVASNGNIVHYKFQEGVSLEDVDFINEKADNGVDTLLGDKIENFSILAVQDGITLMDDKVVENGHMNASAALNAGTLRLNSSMMEKSTDTDETDKNISSSFSLTPMDVSLEAKMIGLKSDGFSVSSGRVDFFTDSFYVSSKDSDGNIEAKKVLLEGDVVAQQMQNYLYTTNVKDLPPIRADLPSEYAVLSPLFWKYVNPYQTYTISTFGPQFYISASNSYSSCDHSIFMGDRDMGLGIVCSTPDEYSAGINIIEHRGPHTSSISVSSGITLTHSYSENAESPSVTQVRIDSDGFTVNGRNI